jgi:hypothetical protein
MFSLSFVLSPFFGVRQEADLFLPAQKQSQEVPAHESHASDSKP